MTVFEECCEELEDYRNLAPNWDSYRGKPIDPGCLEKAFTVVAAVQAFHAENELGDIEIYPCPLGDGGVELVATFGYRTLFFMFTPGTESVQVTHREEDVYSEHTDVLSPAFLALHLHWGTDGTEVPG
jgi:hypothetical protein